jgi:hypothetical protein
MSMRQFSAGETVRETPLPGPNIKLAVSLKASNYQGEAL